MVGVLIRAVTYATLFIGVVLVYLPAQTLSWAGVTRPERLGLPQVAGFIATACGAALTVWCILSFAIIGRGTPMPLDPPRRLVVRGPTGTCGIRCIWVPALPSEVPRCTTRRPRFSPTSVSSSCSCTCLWCV